MKPKFSLKDYVQYKSYSTCYTIEQTRVSAKDNTEVQYFIKAEVPRASLDQQAEMLKYGLRPKSMAIAKEFWADEENLKQAPRKRDFWLWMKPTGTLMLCFLDEKGRTPNGVHTMPIGNFNQCKKIEWSLIQIETSNDEDE